MRANEEINNQGQERVVAFEEGRREKKEQDASCIRSPLFSSEIQYTFLPGAECSDDEELAIAPEGEREEHSGGGA